VAEVAKSPADGKIDYSLYYRKWHSETPGHAEATAAYYRYLTSPYLPTRHDASILDIGCGMGFTLLAYAGMGYRNCFGIDVSSEQINAALAQGLRVEHVGDSAEFLRARPLEFEFISAFDVLEHIPREHLLPLIRAIHGSLKPGGSFFCTVPNANNNVAMRWRYNDWTHHTCFTEHSLDFVLRNGGFDLPVIGEVNYFHRRPPSIDRRIWLRHRPRDPVIAQHHGSGVPSG
jgi:2-polyprenyl-3-methyl-5-hydroxy-6-metoxy-1,4-benzoquinol methylase